MEGNVAGKSAQHSLFPIPAFPLHPVNIGMEQEKDFSTL